MSFEKFKEFHNSNYHDGDSTFDERNYKKSNGDDFDNCFVQDCYDHFEAGAQSRQAEIDELQKRIDEALAVIYSEKSKVECDVYQGVDADLIIGIGYDLHLILKGKNND